MSMILLIILLALFGLLIAFTINCVNELSERDQEIKVLHELRKTSEEKALDYYESWVKYEMAYKNLLAKTNDNPKVNRASQVKYDALQKQYDELHVNVVELRNHITRLKKSKGIK